MYAGSSVQTENSKLEVTTRYPWDGKVEIRVTPMADRHFTLALRIPGWCMDYQVSQAGELRDGYYYIERTWNEGDTVELNLAMPVQLVRANPRVRENMGKAVLMRGPVVYCLEEADNGRDLHRVRLMPKAEYHAQYEPETLGGIVTIRGEALVQKDWTGDALYQSLREAEYETKELVWIPYYAWANREAGEMMVWIRE